MNAGSINEFSQWPIAEPTAEEAERYLDLFRKQMLPDFPFVQMLATTNSAQQLRRELRLVYLAIIAGASTSVSQRQSLGAEVKQTIIENICSVQEPGIESVLAVLILLSWSAPPFKPPVTWRSWLLTIMHTGHDQFVNTPQVPRFMQLATSMVLELRLTRSPLEDLSEAPGFMSLAAGWHAVRTRPSSRTMEERRAVLACFVQSSMYVCIRVEWTELN